MIIFVVLLGVLNTCCLAEIIPYEPDMYNDSAGKRHGIHGLGIFQQFYSCHWCLPC